MLEGLKDIGRVLFTVFVTIPVSLVMLYVGIKGSWLILKYVWFAAW